MKKKIKAIICATFIASAMTPSIALAEGKTGCAFLDFECYLR